MEEIEFFKLNQIMKCSFDYLNHNASSIKLNEKTISYIHTIIDWSNEIYSQKGYLGNEVKYIDDFVEWKNIVTPKFSVLYDEIEKFIFYLQKVKKGEEKYISQGKIEECIFKLRYFYNEYND